MEAYEELIEEVKVQSYEVLDECLDMLTTAYEEFNSNKDNKEIEKIYKQAEIDLKSLLQEYSPEDIELVEEAYESLFEDIKEDLD